MSKGHSEPGEAGTPDRVLDLHADEAREPLRSRRRIAIVCAATVALLLTAATAWADLGDPRQEHVAARHDVGAGTHPTGPVAAPTTSTPREEPSSTTTAPASPTGPTTITGTYIGAGRNWEPERGDCEQFAHRFDAVVTLDSGVQWEYRADYCGVVDGVHWSGTGPFAFLLPDGDRIEGTLVSAADLPSTGEPYELVISGGTGRWSGASGTCALTNRMRPLPSGLQEQAGEVRCTVNTMNALA